MTDNDKRLIEDYLPIQAISAEAAREKSVRQGHPSTLHLWWARRPLVACRAAVYGALVPASRFIPQVNLKNPPKDPDTAMRRKEGTAKGLGRGTAAQFVERLCKYPGFPAAISEAQKHILEAHAERLASETKKPVTATDILEGRASRPKVLDMFAGGGAIPLEALRLGCEAYGLDLNPVAHVIELCTLVYPQKFGKADRTVKGCAKDGTWAGLAEEVRHWGTWVLKKVKSDYCDLYPPIADPKAPRERLDGKRFLPGMDPGDSLTTPEGYLTPVAYLWTRTIACKNPGCGAIIPLVRQTWLCKKQDQYVALKTITLKKEKRVRFEVVEARTVSGLGFDPAAGSKGGNATCAFCGTVADDEYVRERGMAKRVGTQLMTVVTARQGAKGKTFISGDYAVAAVPEDAVIRARLDNLIKRTGLTIPNEAINALRPSPWTRGASGVTRHGLMRWSDLFTHRQLLYMLALVATTRDAEREIQRLGYGEERTKAILTCLGALVDRQADYCSTGCTWEPSGQFIGHTFTRQALPMVWDFAELAPFGDASGSPEGALNWIIAVLEAHVDTGLPARLVRGSATSLPWDTESFDAVVTDPPYYDNVPYADISDYFYVWLRRTIGHLYPEHFASELAPKKNEATALSSRYGGDMDRARREYEEMMAQSFREAHRVLKPCAPMVVVYAHKTTLGWSTLVEALRKSGFVVTEAWPLDTERPGRTLAIETAALTSSISLVARKRDGEGLGRYEDQVRPELEGIVRERVSTLWDLGVSGADLVIACVGAGLRAFTRFARVEFSNGEEVPAERFLTEVETAVLESILARLSKEVGGNGGKHSLAGVDPATRFYTLWRYTYKAADLDAGETIVFANGTHVELEGPHGLTSGTRSLVEKKKGKYRLRDYAERGEDEKLGLPKDNGEPAQLIDVLHRTLWLMEARPGKLAEFLREAQPNREQMRLVAQALAGPALKGGELSDVSPSAELSALAKLTANWRSLVEEAAMTPAERDARTATGQKHLDFGKERGR